jgi:hypothetical protein
MVTQRWTSLGLACTIVLSLVGGCKYPPKAGREDPLALEDYPRIAVLERLHRAVVVADVIEQSGPPLRVTVVLRNKANDDERWVQYRFIFFDAQNRREHPDPDWHTIHMPARTHVEVSGNALDARIVDWNLEVRPAR